MGEMQTAGSVGQAFAARLREHIEASGGTWAAASATISTTGSATCSTCRDLGYVRFDVPLTDAVFGKLYPCPDCELGRAIKRDADELRTGQYSVQLPDKSFANFKKRGGAVDKALVAAQRFAEKPARCMVLWGPSGTGKTHLAAAAANAMRARGVEVGFFVVPDLLDLLRSGYSRGDYDQLLDVLKNIAVLVLDDLGAEKGTDWATEKLFQIINYRYNRRMPLLVAMNSDPDTLEERIADRLCDVDWCLQIRLEVDSWRRRDK